MESLISDGHKTIFFTLSMGEQEKKRVMESGRRRNYKWGEGIEQMGGLKICKRWREKCETWKCNESSEVF